MMEGTYSPLTDSFFLSPNSLMPVFERITEKTLPEDDIEEVITEIFVNRSVDHIIDDDPDSVYMRMFLCDDTAYLVIAACDDVLQTKYVGAIPGIRTLNNLHMGDAVRFLINDVTVNNGSDDIASILVTRSSPVTVNVCKQDSVTTTHAEIFGTWLSTILPQSHSLSLTCEVIDMCGDELLLKCVEQNVWKDIPFNRLPMVVYHDHAYVCDLDYITQLMFRLIPVAYLTRDIGQWPEEVSDDVLVINELPWRFSKATIGKNGVGAYVFAIVRADG